MFEQQLRIRAIRTACRLWIAALLVPALHCGGSHASKESLESAAGDAGMLDFGESSTPAPDETQNGEASCEGEACGGEATDPPAARPDRPSKTRDSEVATARDDQRKAPAPKGRVPFISIDERLRTIHDDLRAIENPSDRERARYIDLTHLSNGGASAVQLEAHRQAVAFLINSLSTGQRIVAPRAVDEHGLLLAIDLRDYAWNRDTWEQIVRDYPYELAYDANSRIFPFDEDTAAQNRDETETDVPAIEADWFLAHAALPPLYYDVLRLPTRIDALALDLGIDINRDLADEQVTRAGFNSAESLNNRVIQRHEQPGFSGALWLSFDFVANDGDRNVFAHPLDFRHDAGSGLFNLPNGLQAYFLMDQNFTRIDRANSAIVSDPNSRDHVTVAGLSCMGGCHLTQGVVPADDQVHAQASASAPSAAVREAVLALYPGAGSTRDLMTQDGGRYVDALRATGFGARAQDEFITLVRAQQDVLDLAAAAATLGISEAEVRDALDANSAAFPPEIAVLRQRGGTIHRDTFDVVFGQFAQAMGIGRQIVPQSRAARGQ